MALTEKEILNALGEIQDTDFGQDIVTLGRVRNIKVAKSTVALDLVVPTPIFPGHETLRAEISKKIQGLPRGSKVEVRMVSEITGQPAGDKATISGVKNIVAIGSGKGGVGKSTVSANIAVGLARYGARVGLVDGDIYGPTMPIMMGHRTGKLEQREGRIIPAEAHGVKFMSMGFVATGSQPLVWRGPMAHRAVQESLLNVNWGELDYLIVDMPPGTGDVHLTLVQTVALAGAVLVSTPQDIGLTISMKTFRMFEQTNVHSLGMIENMSFHTCSHCGEREEIFGHGTVAQECEKLKVPFLGEIPLDKNIREHADQGSPIVIADPDSPPARAYLGIIERLAARISLRNHFAKPVQIIEEAEPTAKTFSV